MKVNQPYFAYFALTAELAAPPRLLFTVTFAGFTGHENAPVYLPPPLLVSVPIATPVDVTDTVSVALVLVLVAWTFRILLATTYSATLMPTLSADGGGGGRRRRRGRRDREHGGFDHAAGRGGDGTDEPPSKFLTLGEVTP